MAFLHEEDDDHNTTDERKEYGTEVSLFVIVAKFGGHTLRHLASRLVNVIRQGGRLNT